MAEYMSNLDEEVDLPDITKSGEAPEEEVVAPADSEIEVEVVDDTPPEDRGREPMRTNPEPTDEELASYSEAVQKRIKTLQRGYHDQRRIAEAADRERQEALRFAQSVVEQNKALKSTSTSKDKLLHETFKSKAETDLAQARAIYKAAYESGDSEALTEAQEALNRATIRHEMAVTRQAPAEETLQQDQAGVKSGQRVNAAPPVDENAKAWAAKNKWFGSDEEMTGTAYGVHEKLLKRGFHPVRDAERYYEEIDSAMRKRFPEYNWGNTAPTGEKPRKQPPTVVAPVTRTSKGTKVVLTQTQVAIAKRLNIPLQEYARQQALLQQGAN